MNLKKLFLAIILLSIGSVIYFTQPNQAFADPRCITFKVKVTAKNWPAGANKTLQVGCPGDRGPQCTGQIKNIRVGGSQPVILGKCSCFPNDHGCLSLGEKLKINPVNSSGKRTITVQKAIPGKCKITNRDKICGTNGQTIKGTFKLSCTPPTKTPTKTLTPTSTNTPTPTTGICVGPEVVPNVRVKCPNCKEISPTPTATPTITPTPTTEPTPTFTPTPTLEEGGTE